MMGSVVHSKVSAFLASRVARKNSMLIVSSLLYSQIRESDTFIFKKLVYYIDDLVNYSIFVVGLSYYTIQLVSKNDSNIVFQ